jgi:hypothetical protein
MEELFHRLLLVGTVTIITLHFPELICWIRMRGKDLKTGNPHLLKSQAFLRTILRIVFFFYIVLLAYALYHPIPSSYLVFPLVLLHLAGLIIGERDLISEIPENRRLDLFICFLIGTNVIEMGILTVIVLQMHGVVTL